MKKNLLMIGVTGVVLLGGALGVGAFSETTQVKENHFISMKKAEEIALAEVEGTIESVELEKDDGKVKYEIDIRDQHGNDDIDVDIDATTGKVIKVDRDDDGDDKKVKTDTVATHSIKSSQDDDAVSSATKGSTQDINAQAAKQRITKDEAIAIATKETPGKVVEVDYDDGEYEIEILTETKKIEYEIDARAGRIVQKDIDDLDDDDDDDDRYDD
ncbi:PepSY domain-containing protein [Mesobacillus maritimus]|uniref:PepSY domain-containing protein n=1 Tax=Mesobacillus maritimus TaxID=1643336 RepID=UPI00384F9A85